MPLRTAYKLCPHAIFVEGHRERYAEYSHKVYDVLQTISPKVDMASIDEAYLDVTGTGAPARSRRLRAAHKLHEAVKAATQLNCSDRCGILATRCQDFVGPGEAERSSVDRPGE
jgi:DNA polymerase-4